MRLRPGDDPEAALERFQRERPLLKDGRAPPPIEIALICRYHDSPGQALRYLRTAVEKAPDQPYPWYVTGLCQADLESVGAAISSFQRCVDVSPGHEDARQQIANLSNRSISPARWLRGLWRRR